MLYSQSRRNEEHSFERNGAGVALEVMETQWVVRILVSLAIELIVFVLSKVLRVT